MKSKGTRKGRAVGTLPKVEVNSLIQKEIKTLDDDDMEKAAGVAT